jgi:hypothetical protein
VSDAQQHRYCTNKFVELANEFKTENIDISVISGALMTASAVYATYVAAGNNGTLNPSGVDKVMAIYRRTLEHHQATKRKQLDSAANS